MGVRDMKCVVSDDAYERVKLNTRNPFLPIPVVHEEELLIYMYCS